MYKTVLVALSALLLAGTASAHDPFNDPAYPGVQAEQPEQKQPEMPDYTKPPFTKLPERKDTAPVVHPVYGPLTLTTYATSAKPAPGERAVITYTDASGALRFAEVHVVSEDGALYLKLYYVYEAGWVFKGISIRPFVPPTPAPGKPGTEAPNSVVPKPGSRPTTVSGGFFTTK